MTECPGVHPREGRLNPVGPSATEAARNSVPPLRLSPQLPYRGGIDLDPHTTHEGQRRSGVLQVCVGRTLAHEVGCRIEANEADLLPVTRQPVLRQPRHSPEGRVRPAATGE